MSGKNEILTNTVIMPRKLTDCDTKGLKGCFYAELEIECGFCEGSGSHGKGIECTECEGTGRYVMEVPVDWTTIKAIYAAAVEHLGH